MKPMIFAVLLLASCSNPIEEITPICQNVEMKRTGAHVKMKFQSNEDRLIILRDGVPPIMVPHRYFNCVILDAPSGELITIEGTQSKCLVVIE